MQYRHWLYLMGFAAGLRLGDLKCLVTITRPADMGWTWSTLVIPAAPWPSPAASPSCPTPTPHKAVGELRDSHIKTHTWKTHSQPLSWFYLAAVPLRFALLAITNTQWAFVSYFWHYYKWGGQAVCHLTPADGNCCTRRDMLHLFQGHVKLRVEIEYPGLLQHQLHTCILSSLSWASIPGTM